MMLSLYLGSWFSYEEPGLENGVNLEKRIYGTQTDIKCSVLDYSNHHPGRIVIVILREIDEIDVKIIEERGDYCLVSVGGMLGWAHKSHIDSIEEK